MAIFAIADLHLDTGDKPMDVFGSAWERHAERIFLCWERLVSPSDTVLIPGDISWAMTLSQAMPHLERIGALPGRKVILRGNHDYWWSSASRVRDALPEEMYLIQNDSLMLDGVLIAGSRGWLLPSADGFGQDDLRIYEREKIRLELSLGSARRRDEHAPLVCMMHYPPLSEADRDTGFTELLGAYRVDRVVYGHLHGAALRGAFRGEHRGVVYQQVSSDGIGFEPARVM